MVVVFDFDKTLTYKDSLAELFKKYSNSFTWICYFLLRVSSKIGLISIIREKLVMIKILFGADDARFKAACIKQASQIRLTPILDILKQHLLNKDRVILLSASAKYLLEEVFKDSDIEIIGTEFLVEEGKILEVIQHPFGEEKLVILKRNNIIEVDDEYFDSHHDECLKSIAKNWHRVKNGVVVECKY